MAYDIREVYNGGDDWSSDLSIDGMHALQKRIDNYLKNQKPYKGTIYRGIQVDDPIDFKVGQIIDQRGTASWSADKATADRFTTPLIHGTKQRPAYVFVTENKSGVDISEKTAFGSGVVIQQKEVLVPSGVNYRVDRVQKPRRKNGITYVYVTEV